MAKQKKPAAKRLPIKHQLRLYAVGYDEEGSTQLIREPFLAVPHLRCSQDAAIEACLDMQRRFPERDYRVVRVKIVEAD